MHKKNMSSKTSLALSPKRRRSSLGPWKPTILIAEDSIDSREMMQLLLEIRGYRVLAAVDGVHALEVATKSRPDAILLDLQLPRLDGLSVTRNLRTKRVFQKLPIIIISGHDPNRYREEAIEAGCNDYLLKPINFDRLQMVLDRMLPRDRRKRLRSA
jgi:chemosensory pili system protein ChpA (sensor histidine kinase/response regulator)